MQVDERHKHMSSHHTRKTYTTVSHALTKLYLPSGEGNGYSAPFISRTQDLEKVDRFLTKKRLRRLHTRDQTSPEDMWQRLSAASDNMSARSYDSLFASQRQLEVEVNPIVRIFGKSVHKFSPTRQAQRIPELREQELLCLSLPVLTMVQAVHPL